MTSEPDIIDILKIIDLRKLISDDHQDIEW